MHEEGERPFVTLRRKKAFNSRARRCSRYYYTPALIFTGGATCACLVYEHINALLPSFSHSPPSNLITRICCSFSRSRADLDFASKGILYFVFFFFLINESRGSDKWYAFFALSLDQNESHHLIYPLPSFSSFFPPATMFQFFTVVASKRRKKKICLFSPVL